MKFTFQIEPADRTVGIMSESFAGWVESEKSLGYWCELKEYSADFEAAKLDWFDNDSNLVPAENLHLIRHRFL